MKALFNAAERDLGERTNNRRRKHWYDEESQRTLFTKNKTRIQMLQCPTDRNIQRFNDLIAKTRRMIRKEKMKCFS